MYTFKWQLICITYCYLHVHAQVREFDKFVVVVTKCQTAIDSILPSSTALLLRLELISCPIITEGPNVERLELYRLSVSSQSQSYLNKITSTIIK
jgi:hypothetical protein